MKLLPRLGVTALVKQAAYALCALALVAQQGALAEPQARPWAVRAEAGPVPFKGVANDDELGKEGTMMYPAPNLIGLVAGIAAHAALVSSGREDAKRKSEEAADKVLDPYRQYLSGFTQEALLRAALPLTTVGQGKLLAAGEPSKDMLVHAAPVFAMTQDRSALVLESVVVISGPGGAPAYQNTVRVVSQPHTQADLTAYWGAAKASALKEESAHLLAQSLDLALAAASRPAAAETPRYRSVHYAEGGKELVERAQVLSERCGRAVLRTLRGWLMSVPLTKTAPGADADPGCAGTTR
jgi:hypothetical protein